MSRHHREAGRFHVPDFRTSKPNRLERQPRSENLLSTLAYPEEQEDEQAADVATTAATVATNKVIPHQDALGSETRGLQDTIGNLRRTNAQLTGNLYNIGVQLQEQEKSNTELQEQLRNVSKRSTFWSTSTADTIQFNQLRNEYSRLKRELEDTKLDGRKQIDDLQNQYFLAQQKVDAYEHGAQQAQEQSFKNMNDARWTPRDDGTFTRQLTELQRSIRDWAKGSAAAPLAIYAMLADTELVQYLANVVQLTSDGALPVKLTTPRSKMRAKWPSMLLSAVLSYDIQMQFFAHPFFSFDKDRKGEEDSPIPTLRAVYSQLLDANLSEGHAWRAQMLRILNPPLTANSTEEERFASEETCYRNRVLCENLVKQFREGLARYIMVSPSDQEDNSDKQRKLRDIFMDAAKLATDLWTQKSYLKYEGLRELRERGFHNGSVFMGAHPLHKLDEDDPRLNGQPISIVVHPAILAIGTHDGEDYDLAKPRVLAKAIVWMED